MKLSKLIIARYIAKSTFRFFLIFNISIPYVEKIFKILRQANTTNDFKKIRNILFVGNTNNYPYLLALGLRAAGFNVKIMVNSNNIQNRPENIYKNKKFIYPEWILDVSKICNEEDILFNRSKMKRLLYLINNNVDLHILNGVAISLGNYISNPYVAFLTGSDVGIYANYESFINLVNYKKSHLEQGYQKTLMYYLSAIFDQRNSIASSNLIYHPKTININLKILKDLKVNRKNLFFIPIANTIELDYVEPPKNNKLKIFCPSRISFTENVKDVISDQDIKGTDILLRGFAKYLASGGEGLLYLFKKGKDIDLAKELIRKLNIKNNVIWVKELSYFNLFKLLEKADLVCDQFFYDMPGMVTFDSFAIGRPVMANFNNNIFKDLSEPLPIINVNDSEKIAKKLLFLEKNPQKLIEAGLKSRKYAEKYLTPEHVGNSIIKKLIKINK